MTRRNDIHLQKLIQDSKNFGENIGTRETIPVKDFLEELEKLTIKLKHIQTIYPTFIITNLNEPRSKRNEYYILNKLNTVLRYTRQKNNTLETYELDFSTPSLKYNNQPVNEDYFETFLKRIDAICHELKQGHAYLFTKLPEIY